MEMSEVRVNAALQELQVQIQALMQRNISLAGDLAEARAEVEKLKTALPQQ